MERRKDMFIPRPKGEAGYGEKKRLAHTPPEGIGGVWGEEKACHTPPEGIGGVWREEKTCPYPARRDRRGMERRKGMFIPR